MKNNFRKTFAALTALSSGMILFSNQANAVIKSSGLTFSNVKPGATTVNTDFQQFPMLSAAQDDVNAAIGLHATAMNLIDDKKQLQKYKDEIDVYNEIVRRLNQNTSCNVSQLREHFSDADNVWKKVSAWARDSSAELLAKASDSMDTDPEISAQLKALESGDSSAVSVTNASDSPYSSINGDTTTEQARAMVNAGTAKAESTAADSDMDMDEAMAYGKVRWDVGFEVLKDIYANPAKWGKQSKLFTPWVDQKHVYDVYVSNHYADMEKQYVASPLRPFPPRPEMTKKASYLPEDMYRGDVPDVKPSAAAFNDKTANADEKWCGQTDGKKNVCARVNKGALYALHATYVAALQTYPLKKGVTAPDLSAPYLPQKPLPPWRESVYIHGVEKQIPEIASDLPDPWFKVTQSIDNYTKDGELANLVERHGNTVRYRPKDYNAETGEVKLGKDGQPRIPVPLMVNRISSYLTLVSAEESQKPVKERAEAAIREMSANIISTLEQAGFKVPNPDTFDLSKDEDYNLAVKKMTELQNAKISSAKAKIALLKGRFGGKLLPDLQKMIVQENATMDAMQKDSEFLVKVSRDNAAEINSLLMTAVADAVATANYENNVDGKMEELEKVPAVGCPVL